MRKQMVHEAALCPLTGSLRRSYCGETQQLRLGRGAGKPASHLRIGSSRV